MVAARTLCVSALIGSADAFMAPRSPAALATPMMAAKQEPHGGKLVNLFTWLSCVSESET